MQSAPITPNIKKYLSDALPGHEGGHALVIGESHLQNEHQHFVERHFDELRDQHNVTTIAHEAPPFMGLWFHAYREGRLPGGAAYAADVCTLSTLMPVSLQERYASFLRLINRGADIFCYDSRSTLKGYIHRHAAMVHRLEKLCEEQPQMRERMRDLKFGFSTLIPLVYEKESLEGIEPGSYEFLCLGDEIEMSYAALEMKSFFDANPDYAQRLKDIERPLLVGRDLKIDNDALSAELIRRYVGSGKNCIVTIGEGHLSGIVEQANCHSSFAHHLERSGARVTTAHMTTKAEWNAVLREPPEGVLGRGRSAMHDWGHTEIPAIPMLLLDEDRIIDPKSLPRFARKDSIERYIRDERRAYADSAPTPMVHQSFRIGRMQEKLALPTMQEALAAMGAAR